LARCAAASDGDFDNVERDLTLARAGNARALEQLLRLAEPLVMNLALRMLGRREDALDATQEVLLRVATNLPAFRGDSRFTTWVYRIAANALTDQQRARRGMRERSFSELARDIEAGIDRANAKEVPIDPTTPEQRVAATELALVCTQGMLMALEPEQRLAYLLAEVMGFEGQTAAAIADISHEAFRQRLTRARERLRAFVGTHCGLVSSSARCHCTQQLRGLPDTSVRWLQTQPLSGGRPAPLLHNLTARQGVQDIKRLQTAAQVFRAHPGQTASPELAQRVREQLANTVFDGQVPKTPPA
jgi:RNA polymerase sigma factor (sigma-70 family)